MTTDAIGNVGAEGGAAPRLLDTAPVPLLVLDERLRVRRCNTAMAQLIGAEAAECRGRPLSELVVADDRPALAAAAGALRAGEPVAGLELRLESGDGRPSPMTWYADPFCDGDGRLLGGVVVLGGPQGGERPDPGGLLSPVETELQEKIRLLEGHVRELAGANERMQRFVDSLAHDLRGPLRVLDGFERMLEEEYGGGLDATARDYLERIRRNTGHLSALLDALAGLYLTGAPRPVRRQPVDLAALAEEVVAGLRQEQPERRVALEVESPLRAEGDPELLRLLLANLLGNAWKYTAGHDPARIALDRREEAGRSVFTVRDDGPGFANDQAERIFEPFVRLHSKEVPGSGLGLMTVRRVVEHHGGTVWAEAAPGEGAALRFTLGPERRERIPLLSLSE